MVAAVYAGALAAALLASGSGSAHDFSLERVGVFAPPTPLVKSSAVTYDRNLVPASSWIRVRQHTERNGTTTVDLHLAGVRPDHVFGVHIHQKACGTDPAAAGKHYQNKPGTSTHHVNDKNEVWLDFKSDGAGMGHASSKHTWAFRKGQASSVVIHSEPGMKGARVACFTVPFGGAS
ncbi:superoxide dismutase family protein [Streptomyces sp. NPDC052109]|uniref:superoxide dismutase family protein n=1 Tax=Streptomyces sp. NPDC052109 TaxID=3155527 RepID=UPI0034254942